MIRCSFIASFVMAALLHGVAASSITDITGTIAGLARRQDFPDEDRYDQLYSAGQCELYLPYNSDPATPFYKNTMFQDDVCMDYCVNEQAQEVGFCSTQPITDNVPGAWEACEDEPRYTVECLDGLVSMLEEEDEETGMVGYYTFSTCDCSAGDVALVIFDIVVEGLVELGKFLCNMLNVAIDLLIEIASTAVSFIPGGQVLGISAKVAKSAKTFAENTIEAADFFNSYLSNDLCDGDMGGFTMPDDPQGLFDTLISTPDSVNGEDFLSIGCKKDRGSDCRPVEGSPGVEYPVGNNNNDDDDDNGGTTRTDDSSTTTTATTAESTTSSTTTTTTDETTTSTTSTTDETATTATTTTDDSASATTTTDPSTTTTSSDSCGLQRRAPAGNVQEGKLGEAETSKECGANGITTVHVTSTSIVGSYLSTVGVECPVAGTQACYHYRSMMSVYSATKGMTEFTCTTSAGKAKRRTEPDVWGKTAVAKLAGKAHHWGWPWANGWIPNDCQRDEWPPLYFWYPAQARRDGLKQLIRLIPDTENSKAGNVWNDFCNRHDAQSTNVAAAGGVTKSYVQSDYVTTVKTDTSEEVRGGTTTKVTTASIETLQAVFSLSSFPGLADPAVDPFHGLKENPCWPSDLAPDDPGWAVETTDEFYVAQQTPLAVYTAQYRKVPPIQSIKDGLARNAGKPPHPAQKVDLSVLVAKKIVVGLNEGQVPPTHTDVLRRGGGGEAEEEMMERSFPRIPERFLRLSARNESTTNGTLPGDGDDGDYEDVEWGVEDEVDLGGMSETEFLAWFEEYVALMFGEEVDIVDRAVDPTVDGFVDAQATAVPTTLVARTMPASAGSAVTWGAPAATGEA